MNKYQEKAALLAEQISYELGIDIQNYNNPEALSKITDIVMIQKYCAARIYKPILISIGLFILGFFVFKFSMISLTIYIVFGLFLFLISGLLYGISSILKSLKKDLIFLTQFGTDTLLLASQDLSLVNTKIRDEAQKPLTLLLEGIFGVIVIPHVTNIFGRIPFAGPLLNTATEKGLSFATDSFSKYELQLFAKHSVNSLMGNIEAGLAKVEDTVHSYIHSVERSISRNINIVHLPVKIGRVVSACLLILLLFSMKFFEA